jgi:hypothetical protein
MRLAFLASVIVIGVASTAAAQWFNNPTLGIPRTPDGKPKLDAPLPRLADGKPDLAGVWQPANSTYLRNIMADIPPDAVPFQPWAAQVYEGRLAKDDPAVRCLPAGVPRSFNNLFKILPATNAVTILYEGLTQFREVFMDGRSLPARPNPTWYGYAIGHWDADTLVVESAGYNEKTWLDFAGHPHSESLHVTERYRRTDFGHMDVQVTIDDPGAYTRPFTVTYSMVLTPDTDFLESICENHLDILPRLVGTDSAHPPTRKSIAIDPQTLADYAGSYELAPNRTIVITAAGDHLVMRFPANPDTLTLFAETPTQFFLTTREELVEFKRDAGGMVVQLIIHGAGGIQEARRRP